MMMCRYIQSSQTDLPGPANAELRLREERLSRRVCSACCRPFSLLTNRCDIYTIYYLHYLPSQILDDKTLYIPGLHLRTGGDRGYRFQASTRDSPDKFSVDIPNENNR